MDRPSAGTAKRRQPLALSIALTLLILLPPALRAGSTDSSPDAAILLPHPALTREKHLAALGTPAWHAAGSRGQGVKVAILDTGFRGYRAFLGKALPAQVTVHSFRTDGDLEARDSEHGILCGEVVHAVAPEAELLFANWDCDRPDQFLDAVRWARDHGARVISCSVVVPTWSDGEGGGPIHESLTKLLGHDVLCFASAGNTAQRHWSGAFHDAGDGWHEWAPGRKDNLMVPWGREPVSVELCWPRGADYELAVWDATTGTEVGRSEPREGTERTCAVVWVRPELRHSYWVRVRRAAGHPAGRFHLVTLGGGLEVTTARGSIPFPGDGPEVIAVGAVGADGRRAPYSSCGPNSSWPKPDLVAVVPFPSQARSRPFAGTSAAAPQAAALAALLWSRCPGWNADRVRETLLKSAHDLLAPGHDDETGYGSITLPPLP
ncbi:MAG TPA: S8 family serine peptidase [Gemmataceae bacterium]|nr:S8 family serine peptidase [Gemmataceae bacterium]